MSKPSYLYVIGPEGGPHKLGLSYDPEKRLKQLQTGSPQRLFLKAHSESAVQRASEVERYAHWLLREAALFGEWFSVSAPEAWDALTLAVGDVARGAAVPPSPKPPRPKAKAGRPMLWPEKILAALPAGSLADMEVALTADETKTDFLRLAVAREVRRRTIAIKLGMSP